MNIQFATEKYIMGYKQQLLGGHTSSDCWMKLKEATLKLANSQNENSSLSEAIIKLEQELSNKSKCLLKLRISSFKVWGGLNHTFS